ncbi:MAG: hypothetical protein ACREKE_05640 [bacterium]
MIENHKSERMAAYQRLLEEANTISQLAPTSLQTATFQEVLRHILENERMAYMMHNQKTAAVIQMPSRN